VQGLWFGRILQHKGTDGETRVVLEAQRHESKVIDSYYKMSVVPVVPVLHACGPMWLADNVVPVYCWAESFFDRQKKLLMVSRSWSFRQRLCGVFC
jgi:hypothetical protein